MISNSGSDESRKYSGGKAGDQTGTEWALISWYSRPWNYVLRHPDPKVRAKITELAIAAAKNDNIGYDQNERYTYWTQLKACGYNPAKIKTKCEADCSAGVAANIKAVGYLLGIKELQNVSIYCYTGNLRAALIAAGFEVLTDSKYLTGDGYLFAGDILLYEGHHTATNVTDGTYTDKEQAQSYVLSPISTSKKGLRVTASSLNIRKTPNGNKTGRDYKSGKFIHVIAKAFIRNDPWFQVTDKNWISAKYLTGWVKEPSDKWWYLLPGYTWHKDKIVNIDDRKYAFGNDGYMLTGWVKSNNKWMYANADGVLIKSQWVKHTDGKQYYIMKDGYMATDVYVKSVNKELYYWVNSDGVWEEKWNTSAPDLKKYKVVS